MSDAHFGRCELALCVLVAFLSTLLGCNAERHKSDAELGLTPQQAAGRQVYDQYCARCHEPYSSSAKQGPSLKGILRRPYMPLSGFPTNDERTGEIIRNGWGKMQGFGRVLSPDQVQDLLAYLHTL